MTKERLFVWSAGGWNKWEAVCKVENTCYTVKLHKSTPIEILRNWLGSNTTSVVIIKNSSKEPPESPIDIKQAKTYVRQYIDSFLNEADRIKRVSMKKSLQDKTWSPGTPGN